MRVIIHFYPRKSRLNDDGQLPIYVRFTVKSKRVDLSPGIYIHSEYWNPPGQCAKNRAPRAYTINERLNKLRTEIQDLYNQFMSNSKNITVTTIKSKLLHIPIQKECWKYLITS